MNELAQFLGYLTKVFALGRIVRGVRCRRPYPQIPTRPLFLSLLLGVIIRAGSYLDISKQTKRRRWQHLIHWSQRTSDDALCERAFLSGAFAPELGGGQPAPIALPVKKNPAFRTKRRDPSHLAELLPASAIR